jgi:hypothetical protein
LFLKIIPDKDDVKDFLGSEEQRDFYYVAQDNLEIVEAIGGIDDSNSGGRSSSSSSSNNNSSSTNEIYKDIQADRLLNQIKNREVKTIRNISMASRFDDYNPKTGLYEAKECLKFCFSKLPDTPNCTSVTDDAVKAKEYQECEDLLLELYSLVNKCFVSFQYPSAETHLLMLLKHALSR